MVRYELHFFPESCFSKIVSEWYTDAYASRGDTSGFECCSGEAPTDEQEFVNALVDFAVSLGRRGGVRVIRQITRLALRRLIQELGGIL